MPRVSDADLKQRREDILVGARRCFAQYGYEGATVRMLEQATGKSRGAIFHHFGDKERLFLELAREDARRMADVVATDGLVEVMRELLYNPERLEWFSTRLEITRQLRHDPEFREAWREEQSELDDAIRARLRHNAEAGTMRDDVPVEVLHTYLETVLDGFITRLASGGSTESLAAVLDLVEATVRRR